MISKKFISSSLIYTLIGSLPLASSVILLPFYTNFLETFDFGVLAIYISFTLLIQIVVNFGCDVYIGIHYFEYKNHAQKLKEYIGTVVLFLLALGLIVTLFSLLMGSFSFTYLFKQKEINFFPYGFMCILTAVCNSFFKTYCSLLINQQKPNRFLWVNLFNFMLTIAITLTGLYLYPHSLVGPMWGRLLSGIGIFFLALYFFFSEYGFAFQKKVLNGIFNYSLPVVIYFLMAWVLSYVDRYIINYFLTTADVGVYDFAVKCTLLIEFLLMGLSNSISPKIYKLWADESPEKKAVEMNRYFNSFTAVTILLICLTILLIPLVVPLMVYKPSYYAAFDLVPILSLGFVFRGLFNMYLMPILFYKKTILLPKVFFFSAVIQVLVSPIMLKVWGLHGMAWSILITKPIQVFFLYLESKKIIQYQLNSVKVFLLPCVFLIIVVLIEYFLFMKIASLLIHLIEFLVGVLMLLFVYRKELPVLLKAVSPKKLLTP
jgi:O-antigen/teichoic acid export membrane protein